ncbi:hypothetical protein HPB48_001211 [Haemaphysalis longicornis]|uniref:Uncharacterized protein n=1 Tax=Haemaphysalis longicornis TaxID=44386 RepID=A0A9J6FL09_HAELO|nr:hypothetical protein HPB48_001211 [Haemaphysalis longicornis]
MLAKNQGLRSLTFEGCRISSHVVLSVSDGLHQNSTLERLDSSTCSLMFPAAEVLWMALGVNQTQRSLNLGTAASRESEMLWEVLARDNSFGRPQMGWGHWDAPMQSMVLLNSYPTDLHLCQALFLGGDSFSVLLQTVASSVHLKKPGSQLYRSHHKRVGSGELPQSTRDEQVREASCC